MGIQLVGKILLLPKDDGMIEVRDAEGLALTRIVNANMKIHRAKAVDDQTMVILDGSFRRLVWFDFERGKTLGERRLKEPAKELAVDKNTVGNAFKNYVFIDWF